MCLDLEAGARAYAPVYTGPELELISIVTDSTSDLPQDVARDLGITIVPLNVHFGTEVFKDGVDLSADDFYMRLVSEPYLPKTSQPSPGDFVEVYEHLGQDAEGILSIHLSSKVSGTYNSALLAKEESGTACPIEVIDTLHASMGVGMVAIAAARAAQSGAGLEETTMVARLAVGRCECFALLDTLEYLEKGGRIGKARAFVGSLLRVRPMIIVRDGEVHELGKERTRARAISRLESVTRGFAPIEEACVLYNTTPDDAFGLARDIGPLLPEGKQPFLARFGPAIGTYTGPGALGIGLLRSNPD